MGKIQYAIVILLIAAMATTYSKNLKGYRLVGALSFSPPLDTIPDGTCLDLQLKYDTASRGKKKRIARQIIHGDAISAKMYAVKLPDKDLRVVNEPEYTEYFLQVVLNLGWCQEEGSRDWFHNGDYLKIRTAVYFTDCNKKAKVCKGPIIDITKQY